MRRKKSRAACEVSERVGKEAARMTNWYVMRTSPGREEEALELIGRTVDRRLWEQCRILRKKKLFRVDGRLILNVESMFPGYIFVKTEDPEQLQIELEKSREYPKLVGENISFGKNGLIPVETEDLAFLKSICGENLQRTMELSPVEVDADGNITHVAGVLKAYERRIVRKRLRKRYVLAEVPLFHRKERILFGVCLPGDRISTE